MHKQHRNYENMTQNIVTNTQDVNNQDILPVEEIKKLIDTGVIVFYETRKDGPGYGRPASTGIFSPAPMITTELYLLIKQGAISATKYRTDDGRIAFAWNPEFTGGKA
jgi:hypothetical protein